MATLQSISPIFPTGDTDAIRQHYEALVTSTTPTRCTPHGGRRRWARPPTVSDPGFGVWETAHADGEGNLLRFGSPRTP